MILVLTTFVAVLLTTLKLLGFVYLPWGLIGMTFIAIPLVYLALAVLIMSSRELVGDLGEIDRE